MRLRLCIFALVALTACSCVQESSDRFTRLNTAGLTLNGVEVPKDKMFVFIFIGSSNMVGRGNAPAEYKDVFFTAKPHGWNFHIKDTYSGDPNYAWIPAKESIHADHGNFTGQMPVGGGPAMAWLTKLAEQYPDLYFGVVQNADGGIGLYDYRSNAPSGPGGSGYLDQIVDAAKQIQDQVTIQGIVSMMALGGNPSMPAGYESSYASELKGLIEAIRSRLALPKLPFLVSQVEKGAAIATQPKYVTVIQQVETLPSVLAHSAVIPSDFSASDPAKYMWEPNPADRRHYNLLGQIEWSKYALNVLTANGWAPQTVAAQDLSNPRDSSGRTPEAGTAGRNEPTGSGGRGGGGCSTCPADQPPATPWCLLAVAFLLCLLCLACALRKLHAVDR